MSRILVTGGAGFIGSHTCLVLLKEGHELIVLDSFENSSKEVLNRVRILAGKTTKSDQQSLEIINGDIRDSYTLFSIFKKARKIHKPIEAVIHFAGLKAVSESIKKPLQYWDVNVNGTHTLLNAMEAYGCKTFVFSSSATLYGHPKSLPIKENANIKPINTYGHTKAAVEQILHDLKSSAEDSWRIAILRYFNPVGAHETGRIGEDPLGIPNNLFPFISQVAIGHFEKLRIFGGDWPTPDGTCVRDYIHVMDLADGHKAALNSLLANRPQLMTINLGSGHGYSVLEIVKAFEEVSNQKIPYEFCERRIGDVAINYADPTLAKVLLNWKSRRSLLDMCRDSWNWQTSNPNGYSRLEK